VTAPRSEPAFSLKLGCLHSIVIFVLYLAAAVITVAALGIDSYAAGRVAGSLAIVVVLLALLGSFLYQTVSRFVGVALVAGLCFALPVFFIIRSQRTVMNDAERRNLDVTAEGIRHPDLHFVLPHPGEGFYPMDLPPELEKTLAGSAEGRRMAFWALKNQTTSEVLEVIAYKISIRTEKTMRAFDRGFEKTFGPGAGSEVLEDTVVWRPDLHELRFTRRLGEAAYLRARCLASLSGPDVMVCVMTATREPEGLDFVRAGLRFEQAGGGERRQ
jgi:hypothetical protein